MQLVRVEHAEHRMLVLGPLTKVAPPLQENVGGRRDQINQHSKPIVSAAYMRIGGRRT